MSERVQQLAGQLNYPKGILTGQVAIINDSRQGIGAEAAHLFANEGAKVIVPDINSGKSKQVVDTINNSGGKAISVTGNILNKDYIESLVKKAADFGNRKINIIVNNTGCTWDGVVHKISGKQ